MNKLILVIVLGIILVGLIIAFFLIPTKPVVKTGLVVLSPKMNESVSAPIKITGYVNGDGWTGFEGQVGVVNLIVDGLVADWSILKAESDWMREGPVNFTADINFAVVGTKDATLVFRNENPSGMLEKDKQFSLPIKLNGFQGEGTIVSLSFMKDQDFENCTPGFSTKRVVPAAQAIARAALEELLKGPTEIEKAKGFTTLINPGVKINSLVIENGTAKVDFSQELESTGGSCRVTAIRSEITSTLKQFPTIKNVIISINGDSETILQP